MNLFGLPFEADGSIGQLHLQVPWKSLGKKPVIATARDVVLTLRPTLISAEEHCEYAMNLKNRYLDIIEGSTRLGQDTPGSSAENADVNPESPGFQVHPRITAHMHRIQLPRHTHASHPAAIVKRSYMHRIQLP